jgi:hypothetical protein
MAAGDAASGGMGVELFSLAIICAFIVVLVFWHRVVRKRHRAARKALGDALGLRFEEKGGVPVPPGVKKYLPAPATHVLRGTVDGFELVAYDISFEFSDQTYLQTVAVVTLPGAKLPQFRLDPEGPSEKLLAMLGGQDIDFEDSPDFSGRFRLTGPDEPAIRIHLTPGMRARLERLELPSFMTVEAWDDQVACFVGKRVLQGEALVQRMKLGIELAKLLRR